MNLDQLKNAANNINKIAEQIKTYKSSKKIFLEKINQLNSDYSDKKIPKEKFDEEIKNLLRGNTRQEELEIYDKHILYSLNQISKEIETLKIAVDYKPEPSILDKFLSPGEKYEHMEAKLKKKYLKELNVEPQLVKNFLKRQKSGQLKELEKDYVTYEPNEYGKISNVYVGKITNYLLKNYPSYFEKLFHDLKASGFKVLSKTYVSMLIFSTIISAIIIGLLASIFFSHPIIPLQILRGLLIGIVAGAATGASIYLYPSSVVSSKQSSMKAELPFVLIHMSAVAGSGAKPIAIFQTLLTSKDYPSLAGEIKKIVNYVNVFGYDLSTSLRLVAMTTPSPEFKDLLNGMMNTISSGGDLKQFLTSISQDSLSTYQMERKKSVEVISTYSDIYTAILIAAPLLFFVTIAIIQMLGGKIGGLPVEVIATIGTYGVIPLLNIGYLIFISAVQPK
ncbi:MAG: type II secretion system F family protein [archaeon]